MASILLLFITILLNLLLFKVFTILLLLDLDIVNLYLSNNFSLLLPNRFIFSSNVDTSNQSYRLLSTGSNFKFEVGATGGNYVQTAIPTGINTVRAEYKSTLDDGELYVNGTLGDLNNVLNSQATDFGLFHEASLGAQITSNGNPPTVSNKLSADLYSFVLFTRTLTNTEKQNIEHTLKEQTGAL